MSETPETAGFKEVARMASHVGKLERIAELEAENVRLRDGISQVRAALSWWGDSDSNMRPGPRLLKSWADRLGQVLRSENGGHAMTKQIPAAEVARLAREIPWCYECRSSPSWRSGDYCGFVKCTVRRELLRLCGETE